MPGRARLLSIDGADVALFRIADEYYAVDNHCPHQHFSKLHEGFLQGSVVTCPMHGWSFDLATGACTRQGGRLIRFKVTVDGGDLVVEPSGQRALFGEDNADTHRTD